MPPKKSAAKPTTSNSTPKRCRTSTSKDSTSNNNNGLEILETPVKSPIDTKIYRAIKLPNGLQAILINDRESDIEDSDEEEAEEDFNCVDISIGKFNKNILGIDKQDCCNCKAKKLNKKEQSKTQRKTKNRKKYDDKKKASYKLKKEKEADKSTCFSQEAGVALCIEAGSFDEPEELPGLAHLAEHSIFLGSKKYPNRETLDEFLSNNGGSSNGSTFGNQTVFTFTVNCSKLEEALEIFVELFKDPLLLTKDIINERDTAVEAEFKDKQNEGIDYRLRLLQLTAKKGHPFRRFVWGNKESLQTKDGKDESLAKELRSFIYANYTIDKMSLIIQAPESLDNLQDLVIELFGDMKSNSIPTSNWLGKISPELKNPFDTNEFKQWYRIIPPLSDSTELVITWALPPELGLNYRTKALHIIGYQLANPLKGGLADFLRKRYWIKYIDACPGPEINANTEEYNNAAALFYVSLTLTKLGVQHLSEVLLAIFSYIKFSISEGPQEWFCTEHRQLAALEIHFTDQQSLEPFEFCKELALSLRKYGSKDAIGAPILIYDWDPQAIATYMKMLKPSNANFMYISKHFQNCEFQIEHYFGTKYKASGISPCFLEKLSNVGIYKEFQSMTPNLFITNNFCPVWNAETGNELELEEEEEKVGPHLVVDNEFCQLWHKLDLELASESIYMFELISHLPFRSIQMAAMLDLWIYILTWNLQPLAEISRISKLSFNISRSYRGVFLVVDGLSEKLKLLLDNILLHIFKLKDETTEQAFDLGKHGLHKDYSATLTNTPEFASILKDALTTERYWLENDLNEALKSITYEMFGKFCQEFIAELLILGLMQGNVADSGVIQLGNDFKNIFNFEPSLWKPLSTRRAFELPKGETICRVKSMNQNDDKSCIIQSYQIGVPDLKEHALCLLLTDLLMEPAYAALRNKAGLGYFVDVTCDLFNNVKARPTANNVLQITITVETNSTNFTASYVKDKIDDFILDFYNDKICQMNEKEFNDIVDQFGFNDDTLDRNWDEIQARAYKFDRYDVEIQILAKLPRKSLKDFYSKYFLPGENGEMRKLCVQVVGKNDKEFPEEYMDGKILEQNIATEFPLIFLSPAEKDDDDNDDCEEEDDEPKIIKSISFKNKLFKYPVFKNV